MADPLEQIDFQIILKTLLEHKVDFILVGGPHERGIAVP
jgi:hypothetical protein